MNDVRDDWIKANTMCVTDSIPMIQVHHSSDISHMLKICMDIDILHVEGNELNWIDNIF